jgi:uncharacterized protein YigA (DUF484 family)
MAADSLEASATCHPLADGDRDMVREMLLANPEWLREDPPLLAELGLRLDAANIVDFGPVALSRVSAAHQRESSERRRLQAMARANYAAQAQTHAAVVDVLAAGSLGDLAERVDRVACRRFGLAVGAIAVEGPFTPEGWITLAEGQCDLIFAGSQSARLGRIPTAAGLFGAHAKSIESVALARLSLWTPEQHGVMAFGSADAEAFTADMGAELVVFLARVVERTAHQWPPQ